MSEYTVHYCQLDTNHNTRMNDLVKMPGHLLRRALQINTTIFSEECGEIDLTPVQYGALHVIKQHPGIDATELSALVVLDRSTLGGVLERLEAKDLIMRGPSPDDKRVKLLYITPKGSKLHTKVQPSVRRVEERLMEPLSPEDRIAFMRLMGQLVHRHMNNVPISLRSPSQNDRRERKGRRAR